MRRRFKLVLAALFTICLVLFVESRIEAFVPQIKSFAALKIEEALDGRVKLSIDSLEGGIFHPIFISEIRITDTNDARVFPSLVINNIRTNYMIWDAFFNKENSSLISNLLSRDSCIYINFSTEARDLAGFLRIKGSLEDSQILGYITSVHNERIDFSGAIKDDLFDLEIRPSSGTITVKGRVSEDGELTADIKVNHLRFENFDIVCEGRIRNRIVNIAQYPSRRRIEGEFETKSFILNYKPFMNFKASYKVYDGVLELKSLGFEDSIRVRGKASLSKPYDLDMVITANNVNLVWLMTSLGVRNPGAVISGTMNGKFELKGPAGNPKSNSIIEIRKGTMAKLDFDFLTAALKGEGPVVRIEDSRINRQSGYFVLAGEMDFRKLGKDAMLQGIKIASDDNAITWDSWDTNKVQDVSEIRMKKKISEDINIDYKKFVSEERVDENIKDRDEVRLEYKLHPNESLKMMVGQDKDFLGLEHRNKF